MERRNFAQILKEAKIDIRREYDRLYGLFYLNKSYQINNCVGSLREYCAYYFYSLPFCGTCLTLDDFDDFYGFSFEKNPKDFDLNYLLLFCEYTYNVALYINPMKSYSLCQLFLEKEHESELDKKLPSFIAESDNNRKELSALFFRRLRNKIAHGDFVAFEKIVEEYAESIMDGCYAFDYSEYSRKNWVLLHVCCQLDDIVRQLVYLLLYNRDKLEQIKKGA